MTHIYDQIGEGYHNLRKPDPRFARNIIDALGKAETLVNVGAGAGSYEPLDRPLLAVEPSLTMIRQRRPGIAPVVQASAVDLPFRDGAFDAALAVLTVHHWPDRPRGLKELARVARNRVVILTWDPATSGFWLIDDYFPEIGVIDRQIMPLLDEFRQALGSIVVRPAWCLMTVRTVSSAPIGGDLMNIWIPGYGAGCPPTARSTMWYPVWSGCGAIWQMALGGKNMDIYMGRSELDLGYRLVIVNNQGVGPT